MSTPIEQNTTDLQNILNAVNELPEAGGGGGGVSVQADWNQYDETAADFIKNKPFGFYPTGSNTLSWNGNTEGLEVFSDVSFKVSNTTPSIEDFANGFSMVVAIDGRPNEIEMTAEYVVDDSGCLLLAEPDEIFPYAIVAYEAFATENGVSPGIYFLSLDLTLLGGFGTMVTRELTIPGYAGFEYNKQIEKVFLPSYSIDDLPVATFYVQPDTDNYIYRDVYFSERAEKADFLFPKPIVVIVVGQSGGYDRYFTPTGIVFPDGVKYAEIQEFGKSPYFTAEHTE